MNPLEPFEISCSGVNLVEASAGTGKTYNITSLYIRALIEPEIFGQDLTVSDILVVTFTEDATKELKDRLLERIRESIAVLKKQEVKDDTDEFLLQLLNQVTQPPKALQKLQFALQSFDEAAIFTIHSFCRRVLQEQAFESRAIFDADFIGDESELVLETMADYWRKWIADISEDEQQYPLYEIISNNYNPKELAKQLGSYAGKPYVTVLPENDGIEEIKELAVEFTQVFHQLKQYWKEEREDIYQRLQNGGLKGYTENKLDKCFGAMDDFLKLEYAPVPKKLFSEFKWFCQSKIKSKLNKAAKENDLQPPAHPFFDLTERYRSLIAELKEYPAYFLKDVLQYLRKELPEKKEELQVLSYDDLLLQLRDALSNEAQGQQLSKILRKKYPLALVDEFQDTDPNQYEIFRRIYESAPDESALFMIGDPKQSIYNFRGADIFSYLEASSDVADERTYSLSHNYRSVPNLIKGINKLYGERANPFVISNIRYQPIQWGRALEGYDQLSEQGKELPPIHIRRPHLKEETLNKDKARRKAAKDTASEISRLINGGETGTITIGDTNLKAKDIAVLVRKHKQADMVQQQLQERSIKSVKQAKKSVFNSMEADNLQLLLKALANPGNEQAIKTALALPLMPITATELWELGEDHQQWVKWRRRFTDWHDQWKDKGFSTMFRSVMQQAHIAEHLVGFSDGERRLTNIRHLRELLQQEANEHNKGMKGLVKWLARKRQTDLGDTPDEEQLRLESDEALVKIMTIHSSKGLEFPVVFCPFIWDGTNIRNENVPLEYHGRDNNTAYLDLRGSNNEGRNAMRFKYRKEQLAEDMRLAYVAMTRAEHRLYLTWIQATDSEFSSLGYLLNGEERSKELLESKLAGGYSKPDGSKMRDSLDKLKSENPSLFTDEAAPKIEAQVTDDSDGIGDNGAHLTFNRTTPITSSYEISSFSSLASWMKEETDFPDYDQFTNQDADTEESSTGEQVLDIFNFPKGPGPGTCVHNIFENVSFDDPTTFDDVIADQLDMQDIDPKWEEVAYNMIYQTVSKPLLPSNKSPILSAISNSEQRAEMEFHFQNENIKTSQLLSIIRRDNQPVPDSTGQASAGYLKGFIDLTFRHQDKYYILDYKTNHLGNSLSDYNQTKMDNEILEAHYDLQYHIYLVALHRFLNNKIPDYSYDQHIGGAFYLFLRGINEAGREGIYYDQPSAQTIQKLDNYLREGNQ